ncbi:MAG: hypothetical protein V4616_07730 [Bacteroidota bacterium]
MRILLVADICVFFVSYIATVFSNFFMMYCEEIFTFRPYRFDSLTNNLFVKMIISLFPIPWSFKGQLLIGRIITNLFIFLFFASVVAYPFVVRYYSN